MQIGRKKKLDAIGLATNFRRRTAGAAESFRFKTLDAAIGPAQRQRGSAFNEFDVSRLQSHSNRHCSRVVQPVRQAMRAINCFCELKVENERLPSEWP